MYDSGDAQSARCTLRHVKWLKAQVSQCCLWTSMLIRRQGIIFKELYVRQKRQLCEGRTVVHLYTGGKHEGKTGTIWMKNKKLMWELTHKTRPLLNLVWKLLQKQTSVRFSWPVLFKRRNPETPSKRIKMHRGPHDWHPGKHRTTTLETLQLHL